VDSASLVQAAENGQNEQVKPEKHTSRAKAHNDVIGVLRGLKPPPPSVKAKTGAAKNINAKTRTAASAVKVNARNKKRAEDKRAALNVSKRKTAPTIPPASSAGQGQ
jgi:hypothetical protein